MFKITSEYSSHVPSVNNVHNYTHSVPQGGLELMSAGVTGPCHYAQVSTLDTQVLLNCFEFCVVHARQELCLGIMSQTSFGFEQFSTLGPFPISGSSLRHHVMFSSVLGEKSTCLL